MIVQTFIRCGDIYWEGEHFSIAVLQRPFSTDAFIGTFFLGRFQEVFSIGCWSINWRVRSFKGLGYVCLDSSVVIRTKKGTMYEFDPTGMFSLSNSGSLFSGRFNFWRDFEQGTWGIRPYAGYLGCSCLTFVDTTYSCDKILKLILASLFNQ